MKFTCTRENLVHALELVSGVAGKHTNLPILENILIQAEESRVLVASTNLELAVSSTFRAKVESHGKFTVPAKTLGEYVRLLQGDQVSFVLEGNELAVSCGSSSTKMKGSPADDYPVLPEADSSDEGYRILVEPFRDALSKTVVAVAKNDIRPELSGVAFNFFQERYAGLVLAATDSYRLAEKKLSVAQGKAAKRVIVPGRTVQELIRLLGVARLADQSESQVRLTVNESQLVVHYGGFELVSRMVDGNYPDYTQIIPESFKTTAFFPADVMVNKIKAASLFSTTGVNAVSFDFNVASGTIGVSSTSTQKGEHSSEVDVEVSGEENSILLNHKYVLDGLQHVGGDVEFSMNSADTPCVLKSKNADDYVYIVMPIRQ